MPDVELLQFQKQRSTPKVRLSEVLCEGNEVVHCEIEEFGGVHEDVPHLGMAKAGQEEQIIRQLQRAGSLGPAEIQPSLSNEMDGLITPQEEQKV